MPLPKLIPHVRMVLLASLIAAAILIAYASYAAYPLMRGPVLTVGSIVQKGGTVTLSGATTRVTGLTINEGAVPLGEDGTFQSTQSYPPGYTVVTVRATDRFGRSRERTLTFITQDYAS